MKYLFLIFALPIFANAQTLKFFSGAGINPDHVESLGLHDGWIEFTAGPPPPPPPPPPTPHRACNF